MPRATSPRSRSGHSWRKMLAPVRLPSPPITTRRSIAWRSRLWAAWSRPAWVQKAALRAVPIAAIDHALIALVDAVHFYTLIERRTHHGAHSSVHAWRIPAACQYAD